MTPPRQHLPLQALLRLADGCGLIVWGRIQQRPTLTATGVQWLADHPLR